MARSVAPEVAHRGSWPLVWGPAVAVMIAIFAASSVPNLTAIPGGVSDKTAHFLAYALLGALMLRALAGATWAGVRPATGGLAWVVSAAYGASDELHQRFVPGRSAAVDDWIADVIGAAAAVAVVVAVSRSRRLWNREV